MSPVRKQLDQLLGPNGPGVGHAGCAMRGPEAAEPCPCCGERSGRFYRVRLREGQSWKLACVLCAVRVLERCDSAVLGGSARATDVAASSLRKRRRREQRRSERARKLAA